MSNVQFIVNEKSGVVIAVLKGTKSDAIRTIVKATSDESAFFNKRYYINDAYKGKSKCNFSEGDVFSEEEGKKIALDRLMVKINTARANAILRYMEDKIKEQIALNSRLIAINKRLIKK